MDGQGKKGSMAIDPCKSMVYIHSNFELSGKQNIREKGSDMGFI